MGPNNGHVMGGFWGRRLEIRICFRHLRVAFVGRMQYAPTAGYTSYIEIRTRFRHLRVAFVGRMQYVPTTGYIPSIKKHALFFNIWPTGGNHDREVWPTFGAVHFKNNVLKTYL